MARGWGLTIDGIVHDAGAVVAAAGEPALVEHEASLAVAPGSLRDADAAIVAAVATGAAREHRMRSVVT